MRILKYGLAIAVGLALASLWLCADSPERRYRSEWARGYYRGSCGEPLVGCPEPQNEPLVSGWSDGQEDFISFQERRLANR